ncbi:MAG: hypothetical protein M1834_002968 [Cirrosporium novae-zelandiae]|nr:MAG: hypothetical protein M1834_002968 [Cirrosporium novae-zelandiae]
MSASTLNTASGWHWPDVLPTINRHLRDNPPLPGSFNFSDTAEARREEPQSDAPHPRQPPKQKQWGPRTCRICLETVQPTFHTPSDSLPEILRSKPRVTYESSDPESGRLIRPCKCKGSSRYVHEGCLQQWRHADPAYGRRNFWQCPTCGFRYRLERMQWGRWINSVATQLILTFSILLLAIFLLGFIADPIINLYLDPYDTISSFPFSKPTVSQKIETLLTTDEETSWLEHFVKGLASLGLLSFVKVLLALSPWQFWNLRTSGVIGGNVRVGNNGRDRLASISWIVVMIGVGTFLWGVYKAVRTWSCRTLEKAGERVMDVPLDDDEEEEDNGQNVDPTTSPNSDTSNDKKEQ